MSALPNAFCSRLPQPWTTEVLCQPGLSARQQAQQSGALAGQTREPGLLPRPPKCEACPAVASGTSGLLEASAPQAAPYVTRDLLGASPCPAGTCSSAGLSGLSTCVTRSLRSQNPFVGGPDRPIYRRCVTRGHRCLHPSPDSQRAGHSGSTLQKTNERKCCL